MLVVVYKDKYQGHNSFVILTKNNDLIDLGHWKYRTFLLVEI